MIELNLLSQPIKKQIRKKAQYVAMVNNAIILVLALMVISVLLLASQKYLAYQKNMVNQNNNKSMKESEIGKINSLMNEINIVQKDFVKWSKILNNFLALIPEGNTIQAINMDRENKIMTMAGHAKTRDSFLKLKNNLEKSDMLTEIESPISNLLYRTDINFTIKAKLNL